MPQHVSASVNEPIEYTLIKPGRIVPAGISISAVFYDLFQLTQFSVHPAEPSVTP
jgi:hypothetical protein